MASARSGGFGASAGAVVATLAVAAAVLALVTFGGGPSRSLVTPHTHVTLSQGAASTPRSQG